MLWQISYTFSSIIEANSLIDARRIVIEKIKADPAGIISKIVPMEPSCKTLGELFKKAIVG